MRVKNLLVGLVAIILPYLATAQNRELNQTISGVVTDAASGQPMTGVTIMRDNAEAGTVTGTDGKFTLKAVPIGRHTVQASFVGYETAVVNEVLVGSAREVFLEIRLVEKPLEVAAVVVRPRVNKAEALNSMTTLGAKMFSVEEAGRFAGGMDDPARLASSFAGVMPPATNKNGISIHGNSPSLLQWRVEGVEIPSPNHFSDVHVLGGGFMSGLSSNVLGNSDFFVGAFPAEYGNAVSGVFDMKLRNGSTSKYQHAFQVGILGIDMASEGPISRKTNASYVFNYRYSLTTLAGLFVKDLAQTLGYQDLNIKINLPTKRAGTFSLWAVGLADKVKPVEEDEFELVYPDDGVLGTVKQTSGAAGLSHKYMFGNGKTSLQTTFATTLLDNNINEIYRDADNNRTPRSDFHNTISNYVFTSALNHKFGARHTNKTGVTVTNIGYNMDFDFTPVFGKPLARYMDSRGSTNLISAYTSSQIIMGRRFTLTAGVTAQHLALSGKTAVEPRVGLKWRASDRSSFAAAYGLHSRMEKADVYFVETADGKQPNRTLDFTKSHHAMLSYNYRISEDMNLKIEPYYQRLFNVPVAPDGAFSVLNRDNFYITETLSGKGVGENYGVDFTLEKYLTKGYYWMVTGSVFSSRYRGGDGIWHDTKYNRRFTVNGMVGKEWMVRGKNILSVNAKMSVLGGHRYTPVDEAATLAHPDKEVQYDTDRTYSRQFKPLYIGDLSVSYKINRRRVAHEIAFSTINLTKQKDYLGHKYNLKTNRIEAVMKANLIANVSWRIEF